MTAGWIICSGSVTLSGPVMVGLAGVGGAMGVAWTTGFGGVWGTRHMDAAHRGTVRINRMIIMISRAQTGLRGRFDDGAHGTFGTRQAPVRSVGVDLVASEFGLAQFAGNEHGASGAVHLFGVPVGLVEREDEDFLQHFDHVVIRVIVVVQKNDAIQRDQVLPLQDFNVGGQRRFRHDNGRGAALISMRYCAPRDNNMALRVSKMM